jgi:cysteine-rich repeat protein
MAPSWCRVVVVVAGLGAVGCLQPASDLCADGGACPVGLRCGMVGATHVCVPPTCGNDRPDPGEACDDGNNVSGDGCPADCGAPCGDGIVDRDEQCDDGNLVDGDGCDHDCTVTGCGNGILTAGEACDDGNLVDGDGCDSDCLLSGFRQRAYIKASNTGDGDQFGTSVALSADGTTLAVGALGEASAALGINGNQANNTAQGAGAVYVFVRSGGRWTQQAYVKPFNTDLGDGFGCSVALSATGSLLAVGACYEASAATGVGGNPADNRAQGAGAVYVFARSAGAWHQQAYLKASNADAGDDFGVSVALSADGAVLVVGADGEASAAAGVGGDQTDNSTQGAGAVYVFTRSGAIWSQQAYVKASNSEAHDRFGSNVALSGDGATLAVSADRESSAASGVNGNQDNDFAPSAGAVYVFMRSGAIWSQQAYVKASNPDAQDQFGIGLALSGDGATLAVGADREGSAASGIDGDQVDNSVLNVGAVYVLARTGATWRQQAYVKASDPVTGSLFGQKLALSSDGSLLAVGDPEESSPATGIDGSQTDHGALGAGAIYLFSRSGAIWSQRAYVKASNTGAGDKFGAGVALSADGATLVAGGPFEASAATGVGGNQSDSTVLGAAGAVYVFH